MTPCLPLFGQFEMRRRILRIKPHHFKVQLIKILRAVTKECESEKGAVLAHNSKYKIVAWNFFVQICYQNNTTNFKNVITFL
jgi:hypothetical protein